MVKSAKSFVQIECGFQIESHFQTALFFLCYRNFQPLTPQIRSLLVLAFSHCLS